MTLTVSARLLILGLQAKFAKALRPKSRQLYKVIFWNWGPTTIWPNLTSVQFFPQKSLHPTVQCTFEIDILFSFFTKECE